MLTGTFAVKATSSLPLIILLSGMSRAFLRLVCRGLRGVQTSFTSLNPVHSLPRLPHLLYRNLPKTRQIARPHRQV